MPHGIVCSYTLPVTIEAVSEALPEKVKNVGEILGLQFTGDETGKEIGIMTAEAYRKFRDNLFDGKKYLNPVEENDIPDLAKEVIKEAFAGLTPVPVDSTLAEYMLGHVY